MQFDKKGNNPVLAGSSFAKGLELIFRPELRKFILIPVMINVVIYCIALVLGYLYISDLIDQLIPKALEWLTWMLWPIFFISFFVAGFFTFTILANLLASPFYGQLSAKTLSLLTGEDYVENSQPWLKEISSELVRIGYLLSRALPLLILFIVPGINVIAAFVWGIFGAWGMALEYFSYPLENQGILFGEQKELVRSIRFGALVFGGIVVFSLTIPFVNIFVAPAAVVGATVYFHQIRQ